MRTKVINVVVYFLLLSFKSTFSKLDFITANQSIHDKETLVSAGGTFEAGFFSYGNSQSGYFGIWYKSISPRTVVWVANRDIPIKNSSGVFKVSGGANLLVLDGTGVAVWSSNASRIAERPVIQLLDSGNLVLMDGNNKESLLWESFDYPGDTLLLGMKLRSNLATGQYTAVTSWRNSEDPGQGEYSYHIDPHGFPQLVTTKNATFVYRAGSWNGYLFTGFPWQRLHKVLNFSFAFNGKEVSYECEPLDHSIVTRVVLNPSGFSQRLIWSDRTESWELYAAGPTDPCEYYAMCGANSNCIVYKSPMCECLQGFIPKSQEKWNSNNWSDGCVRRRNLNCHNGDGFLKYTEMKLPDTSSSWFDKNMNLEQCESMCLKNCSCTAYANLDIRGSGSGCLLWFGNIVDLRKHVSDGQDIYIRLAASELDHTNYSQAFNKKKLSGIVVGSAIFIMGTVVFGLIICIQKKKLMHPGIVKLIYWKNKREKEDIDLPIFDFSTISNATNNFSESNKLGQGGFGAVYKGLLADGQEIAVKRLSETSGQGIKELKNEVLLISKLQHRNLVKLLGCSIQQSEKLLIYELMPNRSLDYFIFDSTRSKQLDWTKRVEIIGGIARGLLYLHQDSRLRIIHRDLKTSNILVDSNMNPKISDFGLARIFGGDQAEEVANTNRVMGTYGYMPPEYVVHGSFSIKSDVFSFGVIVLEIISGRKNRGFSDPDHHLNLLGHAWRLWNEEKPMEFMDKSLEDSVAPSEILRCVHVGLLCVQKRPEDRPNMACVVLMLNGEKLLPEPSQPGFYTGRDHPTPVDSSSMNSEGRSLNEVSISLLEAR